MATETTWTSIILAFAWKKSEISAAVLQLKFNELLSKYDGYTRIFTDGSMIGEFVAR